MGALDPLNVGIDPSERQTGPVDAQANGAPEREDTQRAQLNAWLDDQDADRRAALRSRKQRYIICAPLIGLSNLLAFIFVNWLPEGEIMQYAIVGNVVALGALVKFAQSPVDSFKARVKAHVLKALSDRRGLVYWPDMPGSGHEQPFVKLGLVPDGADRVHYEDSFDGQVQGIPLRLFECKMEERQGSGKNRRWVTLFEGLMVTIDFQVKSFSSRTLIIPKRGVMGWLNLGKGGLERVKLEDPIFEDLFDVFSNDQVEARYLLTPTFMDRLRLLRKLFDGKPLRAAFEQGRLFIAFDVRKALFEVGDISKPLQENDTLAAMEAELDVFEEIIARLNLTAKTRT